MFHDRAEAGRLLGQHLAGSLGARGADVLVLGIPRGGVIVAEPVALALDAGLDVSVPRKIGAPGEPELAVGALALAGDEEIALFDEDSVRHLGVTPSYLEAEIARQRLEIERRLEAYREGRPPLPAAGKTVVMVDDGIATGLTMRAAVEAVSRLGPKQVVVAAPVAPADVVREFVRNGRRIEVLDTPSPFMAVGNFYRDFRAVQDEEVRAVLRARSG